jgi:hypothetical protein
MKLSEYVTVSPRFSRSINLERDLLSDVAVNGYVLTATGLDCINQIANALDKPATGTSWTLTGPYGTGKSAFALFLTRLLAKKDESIQARKLLQEAAPELYGKLFSRKAAVQEGFCSIVVSATSDSLTKSLLSSAIRDVRRFSGRRKLKSVGELERLERKGDKLTSKAVVQGFGSVILELRKLRLATGIVLIVDELGKALEHAARNSGDIFVLQELAEFAASFQIPGLLLITLLHQSFEQYAAGLRASARNEWAKVQGRFADIAFQDPPEQVLHVLAKAIEQHPDPALGKIRSTASSIAAKMYEVGAAPRGFSKRAFVGMSAALAPIHPVTALCLTRLCRKFGQNQRSLFAFLLSREPNGFMGFLEEGKTAELFGPARLFDYVLDSFGSAALVGDGAVRWAETQAVLQQHPDLQASEQEIIKIVGLLTSVGAYGNLLATADVLRLAVDRESVGHTCKELSRRSILVYRKHSGSFALWQGSDVDIEERLKEAQKRVASLGTLAARMKCRVVPPPVIAKRHSFRTGTLRFFKVKFAAASEIGVLPNDPESDGTLMYVLPDSDEDRVRAVELAASSQFKARPDIVLAIPSTTEPLKHGFRELELLQWVAQNTPELQSDSVARRELRTRLTFAERQLEFEIGRLFSPSAVTQTCWFQGGIERSVPSARLLSQMISDICDQVYSSTPIIRNELLNRRHLSSAAAAARRTLIEAILKRSSESQLGIEGFPPELSMYVSVLKASGMHRAAESNTFELGPPFTDSSLFPVWSRIERFFADCELQRQGVTDLYHILAGPPFGLKQGVIPVLFCASLLCHDTDVALYEEGAFVPEVTTDVFERLLKHPQEFEVRSYRVSGVRKQVFEQYAAVFDAQNAANLVAVVRPLFKFFNRLPDYSKRTGTVSSTAIAVRDALFAAREPDVLLFQQLPAACGFSAFSPAEDARDFQKFFRKLREALAELQRTYDDLLAHATDVLFGAFDVSAKKGRPELQLRARAIADYAVEPRMRALLLHLTDTDLAEVLWIEAVATLCVGKPPRTWTDTDRARFQVVISDLARSFKHLEAMMFEVSRAVLKSGAPAQVLRLGVTDQFSPEIENVVMVSFDEIQQLTSLTKSLETLLADEPRDTAKHVIIAALALTAKKLMTEEHKSTLRVVAGMEGK